MSFFDSLTVLLSVIPLSHYPLLITKSLLLTSTIAIISFPNSKSQAYDDGRTQLLIQLKGTIAIQFRNNTYNIPIEIWIQRAYPREPPIVYVTPTSDMLVRKGKHVDVSGKVEGGYLEAWSRKWEVSSIGWP